MNAEPKRHWFSMLLLCCLPAMADEIQPCDGNLSCACIKAATPMPALANSAIGAKTILIYRVDFSDAPGAAISSNAAALLINDLNNYYSEMSYRSMSFAPAGSGSLVTETLRLPEPSTAYDNNFTKFIEATRQTAAAAGIAHGDFDFDILCTGAKPFLVFGAIAYVGGPGLWAGNNNFTLGVLGHELGHNLGLPHASFWSTGDRSSIGPGQREEYGDPFDSMGAPGTSTNHFNVRFKNFLGWIPNSDAPLVTVNGTYRIAAQDNPDAQGIRALQIPRSAEQSYWLEFRQFFNNRFITNGVTLRWATTNIADNTLLLDTTPGTTQLKTDVPVLIGRTFSDRCADIHITPIGKAGTSPEALDVVVNRGPFPGNMPPSVAITASATNVNVNTPVTFTATATDVNGDTLAYFWDFGDGSSFGPNQSTVQFAWPQSGEYVVRCVATDMKGGTATVVTTIRVGTVSTFAIEGVVRRNGLPVQGALVKAGIRQTYTDSSGAYRLTRLSAGRQTIVGVLDGFNVVNAGFENPVVLGPNASGANFTAIPDDLNGLTLVPSGALWKYRDTGVTPASDWITVSYDDSGWSSGRAKFGYGTGDEQTLVSFGTNTSSRHITTWFRTTFTVADGSAIDHLLLRSRRDDGAVVYLNGLELYRENMPSGPIQTTTTAVADVGGTEEANFFRRIFASSLLVAGTNVIAVEVHQFSGSSFDLSFDLELLAVSENESNLRPSLQLVTATNGLTAQWPIAYPGWILRSTDVLAPMVSWKPFPGSTVVSGNWNTVAVATTNVSQFLLLQKIRFCGPHQ